MADWLGCYRLDRRDLRLHISFDPPAAARLRRAIGVRRSQAEETERSKMHYVRLECRCYICRPLRIYTFR